ncbi:Hypothetical protein R9X50_00605600 [Acrodontium crateriforme]|uniref:Glycosyltransferase family 28 N-terminal domain-containing protein n=1 Tax=Acrodontium crateriforme TaxID=150365 RepID=A0AAQ3RBY6_9PEZI|nr:Hypothetical protein R9X50_00605600 [Acrodontium crateriforme]
MAPKDGKHRESQSPLDTTDAGVPKLMLQHAQDAVAGEQDTSTSTAAEKKHRGHDVPMGGLQSHDTQAFAENVPPPAYGEHYGAIKNEQDGLGTNASVADDGRVNIRIEQKSRRLSSLLVPALRHQQDISENETPPPPPYIPPSLGGEEGVAPPPPMNIVIQVVGSRGDVQPFVALGKVLKETYGHRVRLATHPNFNDFVTENGLEFFSIGGDPAELMAFMVKNPGLMPGFDTLRSGDVGKRRKEVAEYIKGCWRSCYEAGNGLGQQATDETIEEWTPRSPDDVDNSHAPFVADCIIANPPSFAHLHCAEKLGIPLHIMFTMPYSPTQAFPHPLANIQSSNADPKLTNYMSYALIDMLTWQGLGDVINRFRQHSLGLEPISLMWAPGMLQRLKIPHTYCWSPALIPKPKDWGQHICISGFYFLNLASNYTPAPELQAFLDAGPPPVYIGFGSIVLDDPNAMTNLIFDAVKKTGQRVLLSKGWGGMGADEMGIPEGVFMLGNVPHDWLFKHVSCVVHHGGAGTTAAGITAGRPTLVVPFFGDQPFWGSMVARAGAGPEPIHHKQLTSDNLAEAINICLKPESQARAQELADKIASERGSDLGAQSFHQFLNVDTLRCNLTPSRAAVWRLKRTKLRLSVMAACTLATEGLLDFKDLKLFRGREYEADDGPWDPITGGATALVGTISTMMLGVADFPIETLKALKIHPDAAKKKHVEHDTDVSSTHSSHESGDKTPSGSGPYNSSMKSETASTRSSPASSRTNSTFNFQESLATVNTPPSPGSLTPRSSIPASMAEALHGKFSSTAGHSQSRSRSHSRTRSSSSHRRGHSEYCNAVDTALGTGKGVSRIIGAGFNAPMEFTMGVAKGFHNAPKLYGDDTVRKSDHVTDFKSGVKAATKEFGYGMFDGITGLVTQPIRGAQKEGAAGFFKGVGKGIGGIALKPGAAIFSIPGYTMKGVYKELQKLSGSSVQNYIIAARTAQGYDEWQKASPEERQEVVYRWKSVQKDLKKKRNPDEMVRDILLEQRQKRQEHMAQWKEKHHVRRSCSTGLFKKSSDVPIHDTESADMIVDTHGAELAHAQTTTEEHELHEAIKMSVQETSRGNPEEDAAVERAIQASMAELQKDRAARRGKELEDKHLRQAMEASEADAQNTLPPHDEELERALAQSLKEQRRKHGSDSEWDSEPDTEDDEEYKRALKESEQISKHEQPPPYGDWHVEASGRPTNDQNTQPEKTEEEVVMDYVKKQSLLEEEHRQQAAGKGKAPQSDEDDEELQRAMKLSLGHDEQKGEPSGK